MQLLNSGRPTIVVALECYGVQSVKLNKSSAVAEMGDRLATIDIGRQVGAAVPLSTGRG